MDRKEEDMPKKKRDHEEDGGESGEKRRPGRPTVLPPELDKRHQLRCASKDFDAWVSHAKRLGFPNVSAWIRKVANDAMRSKRTDS